MVKEVGIIDSKIGEDVTIVMPSNIYGCDIGDGSFIGPFVEIQRGAVVGKHTKIESHSFICDLVTIGDNCFIAQGVMFINDKFQSDGPACGDRKLWSRTHIGDNVSIGSNATILPVMICSNTVVGAGSVVTKDITKPGVYAVNPSKFIRELK